MNTNQPNRIVRIGAAIGPHDPFWVHLREMAYRRVAQLKAVLVPLEISDTNEKLYSLDPASLAEELLAQGLDAVICQSLRQETVFHLTANRLPIIFLGETSLEHPLVTSPSGLSEAGKMAGEYVAQKLAGRGRVLLAGGLLDLGDDKGLSRINGFREALSEFPDIQVFHCPTPWRHDQAYPLVLTALREIGAPVDAIFGISDSIALAGRDAVRALGFDAPKPLIVGVNGDSFALAAVADGSFSATIETSAEDLGIAAVDLAFQVATGHPLPPHYPYSLRLITAENVAENALRKLVGIANLPSLLVGVNREEERQHLLQLETGAAINRHVGSLLDRRQLTRAISDLICENYGFDHVRFLTWIANEEKLVLDDGQASTPGRVEIRLEDAGLLGDAIRSGEPIFIPDTRYSNRFLSDPDWPETRSRVILPIALGDQILGLLDLHCNQPVLNLRWELIGLRSMADQFAIALRNAELYSEALAAREIAERADQLKTRLLANVSHELRTPLNVILGYSQAALSNPNLYGSTLPEGLRHDLRYIYESGEHLIRIINDLLDLSRAEIGELNVFPEPFAPRAFLKEVFESIAKTRGADMPGITWELQLPARLPVIQADAVRLRQILLNLLSNACKFTSTGRIVLGGGVEPPYLHLWVSDSGMGIPVELQERIFEPFVTSEYSARRQEGVGLGLAITRRLVALHGGSMSLESQPDQGSTFHVYLPLPNITGGYAMQPAETQPIPGARPALVVLSACSCSVDSLPAEIRLIASRQKLEICMVRDSQTLEEDLHEVQPVALAWDMGDARAEDWNVIGRLRLHPQFATLPLILFGQEADCTAGSGVTNILTKPFSGKKLEALIESLRPSDAEGPVLIVDDDPQARALYQGLVKNALPGKPILLATDGAQAQVFLKKEIPVLVILDLIMPQVDGFQVLEMIRSDPRTYRVPVVVLSGKLLTFDDVARLNYANVVFHTKDTLSTDEIMHTLQQTVSGGARLGQPTSLLVKQALAHLHNNFDRSISRSELAEMVGVSENYLTQIFRQELGLSPLECLNRLRIQKARELLRNSDASITVIAMKVGFDDPAYFSRVFRKMTGCSPQSYRQAAG